MVAKCHMHSIHNDEFSHVCKTSLTKCQVFLTTVVPFLSMFDNVFEQLFYDIDQTRVQSVFLKGFCVNLS